MSEPKLISPMLDNFAMGEAISEHHGVCSYPAMEQSSQDKYIVKTISIPASQVQLQALLLTGAFQDETSARKYFLELADGVVAEADILSQLSKMEGFLPNSGSQIVPMENAVGYDVYLLSPYRNSLARYLRKHNMTHLAAVNLGLDLCASLAVCRQAGYLYVNLKPENIFICNDKEYRIGDIGFLKLNALKFASLPDRYISAYSAPEIVDAYSDINTTADIYSAGMVLYQVYNGGELPFASRAGSEELPSPAYADYEMAEIIMKACAPDPKDRWQDPIAMGQALVAYMQRNDVNDVPIVTVTESYVQAEEAQMSDTDITEDTDALSEEDAVQVKPAVSEESVDDAVTDEEPVQEDDSDSEVDEQISLDDIYAFLEEELPAESQEAEDDSFMPPADEEDDSLILDDQVIQDGATTLRDSSEEDDIVNLSFLDDMVSDETAPSENMAAGIEYDDLSQDASDILTMADDLISHETPEGVIPPKPIDVPIPDPIVLSETDDGSTEVDLTEKAEGLVATLDDHDEAVVLSFAEQLHNQSAPEEETTAEPAPEAESAAEEDEPASEDVQDETEAHPEQDVAANAYSSDLISRRNDHRRQLAKKKAARSKAIRRWIVALLIMAFLGGLVYAGYWYYQNYYLRNVSSLTLSGSEDQLVVHVDANIEEELLIVQCIDTYGTIQEAAVSGGRAVFTGLNPNTLYNVKVQVTGMHKLTGEIADSYTTPIQTNIVSFSAVTGADEGTVILTFTVEGMDSDTWTVTYSADGVPESKFIFSGHVANITGLLPGTTYTFRLDSGSELYIVGNDTLEYTVLVPTFAQNLEITGCTESTLDVRWDAPEDSGISSWIVRCYSDSGYDHTIETEETSVTFEGLNGNEAHTVEVIASGMSAGTRCYLTANAVTVSDINTVYHDATSLDLKWDYTGNDPMGQWIVTYNVDNAAENMMVRTSENVVTISPIVPDAVYTVTVKLEDGTTVFSEPYTFHTPAAEDFAGYGLNTRNITVKMCNTPPKANWDRNDLSASDYTDTFKVGTKASFLLNAGRTYNTSDNVITTMFVIRSSDGTLISSNITQKTWTKMWYKRYCELDIPALPGEPGTYTISIYFNGAFLYSQNFTVIAG